MRANNKHCIICKKPLDETFWDKGNYGTERYLCSKSCYSKWLIKWQAGCIRGIYKNKMDKKINLSLQIQEEI